MFSKLPTTGIGPRTCTNQKRQFLSRLYLFSLLQQTVFFRNIQGTSPPSALAKVVVVKVVGVSPSEVASFQARFQPAAAAASTAAARPPIPINRRGHYFFS
jgi:hypothetical protein